MERIEELFPAYTGRDKELVAAAYGIASKALEGMTRGNGAPFIEHAENVAKIAADEIGSVSAMPTITETSMPIRNGCRSVAHMISAPTFIAALPRAGAHQADSAMPTPIVTRGVTRISIFVSLETIFPISAAIIAMNNTDRGPPAPPSVFAA